MLKAAIKAALPTPAAEWLADKVRIARFAIQPSVHFDARYLRRVGTIDFPSLWSRLDTWDADHRQISEIYGDGEMDGGVNPGDRRALYHLVCALKPMRVLEIGTHVGASTVYIASALKHYGGVMTTVDISANPFPRAAAKRLRLPVEFVTETAMNFLQSTGGRFDLIFLDGDHSPAAVYTELSAAMRKMNSGGLIVLHDYYEGDSLIRGPALAIRRAARGHQDFIAHPLGELPWPTKSGSHMTSLALVLGS